jgi:hypothetical protein
MGKPQPFAGSNRKRKESIISLGVVQTISVARIHAAALHAWARNAVLRQPWKEIS